MSSRVSTDTQVKTRVQVQSKHFAALQQHSYRGLWDGLRCVVREGGVRGLFQGGWAGVVRVSVGTAAQLPSYYAAKEALTQHTRESAAFLGTGTVAV